MDYNKDTDKPDLESPKSETEQPQQFEKQPEADHAHVKHAHRFIYGYLILIVIAALAGFGAYLYRQDHKKPIAIQQTTESKYQVTKVDPYSGWGTYTLPGEGYSFRYPSNWTSKSLTNGTEITSTSVNGHDFVIEMLSGVEQSVDLNFLGNSPGTTISKLNAERGNESYYLVAPAISSKTTGLGLATSPGSNSTSFGVIDTGGDNNVTMVAFLVPENVQPTGDDTYTLQMYQQQPDYQTVLKVFQSLSYKIPPTTPVKTADGKITLQLPATWTVMPGPSNVDDKQLISVSDLNQGCLDVDDPVPCIYEAEFQPTSLESLNNKASSNDWELRVEKTNWTLQQAVNSRVGELNSSNTITENNNPINGYQSEYLVTDDPGAYTDVYYFMEDKGYLLTFYNREINIDTYSTPPTNENYSAYESDFAKIANSVQLKF